MTPAEELCAAATRVQCDHTFPLQPPEGSMMAPGDCRKCGVPFEDYHNLLISDRLRDPLALLLSRLAEDMRQRGAVEGSASKAVHPSDFVGLSAPREDWTAALAIARVINGGAR